jgi:AcrR family transcriptional regulator
MMADKDTALLELALAHFAAVGVDAASMTRIARDADIGLGELVSKYETVEALFDAAVARSTVALRDELYQISGSNGSPLSRLVTMLRRIAIASGMEQSALFAVYRELLDGGERAGRAFEHSLEESYDLLVGVISEGQFRGHLAPLPPRFVLATLLSGVVVPQLIGYGAAQGRLHGVHAVDDDQAELSGKPRSAMLAASLEVVFMGVLGKAGRAEFPSLFDSRD